GKTIKHLLILDNASIHKGKEIDELVARYNCRIMYLPAYSPDLNPIEKAWSVLKSKVKNMATQLEKTIDEALDLVFKTM
ncbi:DDE superfamily endonuclease, partial [Acinetobacter calcoaceticus]